MKLCAEVFSGAQARAHKQDQVITILFSAPRPAGPWVEPQDKALGGSGQQIQPIPGGRPRRPAQAQRRREAAGLSSQAPPAPAQQRVCAQRGEAPVPASMRWGCCENPVGGRGGPVGERTRLGQELGQCGLNAVHSLGGGSFCKSKGMCFENPSSCSWLRALTPL